MNFSELKLHSALAKALATRGYETATGVQAAVLDPAVAGRDLLVSSQTGSGKTIAFGVIVAETLLGAPVTEPGAAPPAPMPAYGSKSRSEPAALLRGLANGGLPSSTRPALSASKSASRKNTSPRTSSTAGTGYSVLAASRRRW